MNYDRKFLFHLSSDIPLGWSHQSGRASKMNHRFAEYFAADHDTGVIIILQNGQR
jgi:hypothetical protein